MPYPLSVDNKSIYLYLLVGIDIDSFNQVSVIIIILAYSERIKYSIAFLLCL